MKIQTLKNFRKIFGAFNSQEYEGFKDIKDIKDFKEALKEV